MKIKIIILFLTLISVEINAQIKQYSTFRHELIYDEDSTTAEKLEYITVHDFNKEGTTREVHSYSPDSSNVSSRIDSSNINGNLVKRINYRRDGSVGWTNNSRYDKKGSLSETFQTDEDGRINATSFHKNTYDKNDSLVEIKSFGSSSMYSITSFIYSDTGAIEMETTYATEGAVGAEVGDILRITTMHRNIKGQVYYRNSKNPDGSMTSEAFNKFDEYGNLIETKNSDFTGGYSYWHKTLFKYNEKGDWIKKTNLSSGEIFAIVYREIVYYE